MPLRHPLKRYGDLRQYPYAPCAEELAGELAAERRAHAATRRELEGVQYRDRAPSEFFLGTLGRKSGRVPPPAPARLRADFACGIGGNTSVRSELPN